MEDGLVQYMRGLKILILQSLNPYCSGRWSRTLVASLIISFSMRVLILIEVDNGLVLQEQSPRIFERWAS